MAHTITRSGVPDARLQGKGIRFFCNGTEVPHVIQFDMEEGWIDAWCDGCEHGGPGKHFRNVLQPCHAPRRYGRITYIWPDGRVVEPVPPCPCCGRS